MDKKHALSPTITKLEAEIEAYIYQEIGRLIKFNNTQAMRIKDLEDELYIAVKSSTNCQRELSYLKGMPVDVLVASRESSNGPSTQDS